MFDIRDGMKECASLGVNDVNDIIDEICINYNECIFILIHKCILVYYTHSPVINTHLFNMHTTSPCCCIAMGTFQTHHDLACLPIDALSSN